MITWLSAYPCAGASLTVAEETFRVKLVARRWTSRSGYSLDVGWARQDGTEKQNSNDLYSGSCYMCIGCYKQKRTCAALHACIA
jgi:hypothetical protein